MKMLQKRGITHKAPLPWSKTRRSCDSCSSFDAKSAINGTVSLRNGAKKLKQDV
ncbi:hypothetical protein J4410_03680 [Candidatus Woesearchaeota archaeon]|nr:hypothetical protein [Candidatus Woesearchaeota archaeon]